MPKQPTETGQTATTDNRNRYDYQAFSQLVGQFTRLPRNKKHYKVRYRRLMSRSETVKALALIIANVGIEIGFLVWLFQPEHIHLPENNPRLAAGFIAILIGILIVESFRLVNMVTLCASVLAARDPLPVTPEAGTRVAFTTAIVPSKEPFEGMVKPTLEKALQIMHDGPFDVWLLDEGNVPQIKAECERMGVKHFSRKDIEMYNQPSGMFKARTKHGNHNAWLHRHGDDYDYVISVDSDHQPMPNFAKRMLGYFRDPDVAFVVGPQVYGNFDNSVTKGAESQAYIFQAAIQRAGNNYHSAMFVGTNHAYRVRAWDEIGGFQDSITEDMLTSMKVHSTRNSRTGKYWKSVYTPDVVAVGEGPSSWTDFFSQQLRWSRGSNEILLKNFFKMLRILPWRAKLHYSMIISYYPTVAVSWAVGILVSMVYLVLGQSGIDISGKVWLALYTDVLAVQILLYGWLRKYNVSPHEESGTVGFPGMFFSMVSAPIYFTALAATVLRRKVNFVVTPKGDSTSPDTWMTFRKQLGWAALVAAFLGFSLATGHNYPGVKLWSFMTIAVCLAPVAYWRVSIWDETKARLRRIVTPRRISGAQEKA